MRFLLITFSLLMLSSCHETQFEGIQNSLASVAINTDFEAFDSDTAFSFIEKQVSFGPRVPNLESHVNTKDWIVKKLLDYKLVTKVDSFNSLNYKNDTLQLFNIIASFNPDKTERLILATHWDTRPYADNETDSDQHNKLPDGANDGGSGTAILIEIARLLSQSDIDLGVDFICFDGEEAGPPMYDKSYTQDLKHYCLGSQHFVKNTGVTGEYTEGVLLDIVGGKDAKYFFENVSSEYAKPQMMHFWSLAHKLNYHDQFIAEDAYFVGGDDHSFLNQELNIPTFAIIEYDKERDTYNKHQHRTTDNLENISKASLDAVGTVLWTYLNNYESWHYEE